MYTYKKVSTSIDRNNDAIHAKPFDMDRGIESDITYN